MKVLALAAYGSPDVLEFTEREPAAPGPGEVLVRTGGTSINPYDWHHLRGEPRIARLMPGTLGLRRPKMDVLGCDLAGRVEALGPGVTGLAVGDDVYGLLAGGGFGEYATVPAQRLAPMPANLSYAQAAAVPMAGVTALLGLREVGRLQPGQRVLITGASGGVGTFAVPLARVLGGTVTGVGRTATIELIRSLGADEVIDYTVTDFTRADQRYDLILDIAGARPVGATRKVLTRGGTYVMVGGPGGRWLRPADRMISALARGPVVPQRMAVVDAVAFRHWRAALAELTGYIEAGRVTPVLDRTYPFAQLPEAIRYQEAGHAVGKVVVTY